jgi:hypothetical protein
VHLDAIIAVDNSNYHVFVGAPTGLYTIVYYIACAFEWPNLMVKHRHISTLLMLDANPLHSALYTVLWVKVI